VHQSFHYEAGNYWKLQLTDLYDCRANERTMRKSFLIVLFAEKKQSSSRSLRGRLHEERLIYVSESFMGFSFPSSAISQAFSLPFFSLLVMAKHFVFRP
jgi:hypothetical protein